MRLFDVVVEGEAVFENFDIFEAAGGPFTLYVISTVVNVTDGFLSVQFIPKVNFPTINAIEVLFAADNVTRTVSVSPSSSPTLDVGGQAVSECSAYPVCVNFGFTGSCCPLANGTIRECCFGIPPQCKLLRVIFDVFGCFYATHKIHKKLICFSIDTIGSP